RDAGAHRLAVEVHGAGAALRQPAAEMRIVQPEIVTQRVKERHVRIGVDRVILAVDVEGDALSHGRTGLPDIGASFAPRRHIRLRLDDAYGAGRLVSPGGIGNVTPA